MEHAFSEADLQQLDSVDASALFKSKNVRVVARSVEFGLSRLENVADGFKNNLL